MKACFANGLKAFALLGVSALGLSGAAEAEDADTGLMVRVRAVAVAPSEGGSVDGAPSATIEIDNSVIPELDLTWFFNKNVAAELVLGTTRHTVSAVGVGDIAKVNLLPPTLTLQYHFANDTAFKPYVGAGVNYTIFFNSDSKMGAGTSVDFKNKFGFALQAGTDIAIGEKTWFNIDVKKVFLKTDATVYAGTAVAAKASDAKINPWLIGVGVGYKF